MERVTLQAVTYGYCWGLGFAMWDVGLGVEAGIGIPTLERYCH